MERLTAHSKGNGTPVPNLDTIGDLCMKMDFCLDYDFCEGCPVRAMINRLCEYEDTGLTPEEIVELKEKKNTVAKVQRRKKDKEHLTARVTRCGVLIKGKYYYSLKLIQRCLNTRVDIVIYKYIDIAEVLLHGEHIEAFALKE